MMPAAVFDLIHKEVTNFRKPLEFGLKLTITVRYLATGERDVQYHWLVGQTTICEFVPKEPYISHGLQLMLVEFVKWKLFFMTNGFPYHGIDCSTGRLCNSLVSRDYEYILSRFHGKYMTQMVIILICDCVD